MEKHGLCKLHRTGSFRLTLGEEMEYSMISWEQARFSIDGIDPLPTRSKIVEGDRLEKLFRHAQVIFTVV